MAESLVSKVVSPLANRLVDEAVPLLGVRDEVNGVETELHQLQGFLEGTGSRRQRGDAATEIWISQLRGVAYEMEDVIDTIRYMEEWRHQRRGCMGFFSRYFHKPCELITLKKIDCRIKQIKNKIQRIFDGRVRYGGVNQGESSGADDSLQALRQFPPHFYDGADVVGFEDDKEKVAKLLVDPEKQNRSVISIVGTGGLGKTTLARRVYNDLTVRQHFETFAWISVSKSYQVIKLLKDIMKEVMGIKKKKETTTGITVEDLEQMPEEEVREMLRDFLRGRKYLVAMDDVWDVNVWRQLHHIFPNGNNGSRILLTARKIEVARDAEPWIPPHELQLLNDTQSLELLCRKAFPPNHNVPTELEALAQELAKKCGGLPLALVVLGGLLSRKDRTYNSWLKVAQGMNWISTKDGQECLGILGLSYQDLPYLLKPCFLYIAAFPGDATISVSKLVRLWVAEGFIPQEQTRTMEETARECLDELVQRCMIQVVGRSEAHGWLNRIRIHDILRDFGLKEARMDGFLHVCSSDNMAVSSRISIHRAALHNRINDDVGDSSPHLRTLLGFNLILKDSAAAGKFLNGLNLLTVLDLEGAKDLEELPKQIGNMIHLRYLGLRRTGLKKLPSSIRHLLFLQTLDVRETNILWLPKSFWKIRTLRHVYINFWMFLSAPMIGDHKNLQTLRIVDLEVFFDVMDIVRLLGIRVIKNWVTTPGFSEEAIHKACERMFVELVRKTLEKADSLVSLSLLLFCPNTIRIPGDVLFARAPNLHQLRSSILYGNLFLKQQHLPDASQFPPNLAKLQLLGSHLEQDPMPVLEKLPNLKLLVLSEHEYAGKSMTCSAGGFPRLQQLTLFELPNLEEWRVEVGAMPSLTYLTIRSLKKLKMLPEGLQHVTTLRELQLIAMTREFNGRVRNEDGYKVRHIPSIIFKRVRW